MKRLIFLISFFTYSGYYAGLAFIFALGYKNLSRFYSLPLRGLLAICMVYIIIKNRENLILNKYKLPLFLVILFWSFYFLKVLYTEGNFSNAHLGRNWYEYIFYALVYALLPFLTFYVIDFKKNKESILDGFIFSGFILGIISTYLYGHLLLTGIGRINLITYQTGEDVLSPLALSYAGSLTIVLAVYKLIMLKIKKRKYLIYLSSTIILSFVMFLLGSSRGSVIALLLTFPVIIFYSTYKSKLKLSIFSIILIPVIIWAIEASGSNIIERISNTSEDQGGGRKKLWTQALSHFIENPIFGGKIEIGGIYPHNFLIEILMATGVIGAFLIFPVFFQSLRLAFKNTKLDRSNLFVLLILLQSFSLYSFSAGFYTSILLFTVMGMVYSQSTNP